MNDRVKQFYFLLIGFIFASGLALHSVAEVPTSQPSTQPTAQDELTRATSESQLICTALITKIASVKLSGEPAEVLHIVGIESTIFKGDPKDLDKVLISGHEVRQVAFDLSSTNHNATKLMRENEYCLLFLRKDKSSDTDWKFVYVMEYTDKSMLKVGKVIVTTQPRPSELPGSGVKTENAEQLASFICICKADDHNGPADGSIGHVTYTVDLAVEKVLKGQSDIKMVRSSVPVLTTLSQREAPLENGSRYIVFLPGTEKFVSAIKAMEASDVNIAAVTALIAKNSGSAGDKK